MPSSSPMACFTTFGASAMACFAHIRGLGAQAAPVPYGQVEAAVAEKLAAPPQEPCASDKGWQKEAVEPREAETAALQGEVRRHCVTPRCRAARLWLAHAPKEAALAWAPECLARVLA